MKTVFLACILMSQLGWAQSYKINGIVSLDAPQKAVQFPLPPKRLKLAPEKANTALSGGLELGQGSYLGNSATSPINGLGFVQDYALDPHVSLEGRLFFSSYTLSAPYYYSAWNGWQGEFSYWQRYYWPRYVAVARDVDYSQVSITLGPNYRFLKSKFSPVLGGMLGYSHRSFTSQTQDSYYSGYSRQANGTTDTAEIGLYGALDYKVTSDISVGAYTRFMDPVGYTTGSSVYYPGTNTALESLPYYVGGLYLKFNF